MLNFPFTHELKDYQRNPIAGGFYEFELQKTTNADIHLIEKVLKKRENEFFVKWLGFDSFHNSWIDKSDLQGINTTVLCIRAHYKF